MELRVLPSAIAGLVLAFAAPAFAQSGQIACQKDLERATEMYRQKQSALTEAERKEASDLMAVARSKCEAGGSDALNTRSPEATALLNKLENAPMPSQAAMPPTK